VHLRDRVGRDRGEVALTQLFAKTFRPVGLILSPMMQNGCSAPIVRF
jgi:hypothetical protein